MEKKRKLYIFLTILFSTLLFVWIGVAAYLSGDGDLGLGPEGDRRLFFGFLAVELPTLFAAFFFAVRAGRLNVASGRVPPMPKLSPTEKKQRRRSSLLVVLGAALSYGTLIIGILRLRGSEAAWGPVLGCLGFLLLCAALNPLLLFLRGRQLARRQGEEGDDFLLARRENASAYMAEKLRALRRLRAASGIYAAMMLLSALVGSFWLGSIHSLETVIWLWWPFGFFAGFAVSRLPLPVWNAFTPGYNDLQKEDFPLLRGLCERAAEAVGCRDRLYVRVVGNSDVSVGGQGGECVVDLGIDALLILTEEELYQCLLRAFAPAADRRARAETRYAYWLQNGRGASFLGPLCALPFRFPDAEYELQYQLCSHAAAVCSWEITNRTVLALAEPKAAASSLLRMRYYELWRWEQERRDFPERESYEELLRTIGADRPESFRRDLPDRRAFWDGLIDKELLGEDWSGETLRDMIGSLDVKEAELLPYELSPAYREELARAAEKVDDEASRREYEEEQASARKTIEAWEAGGRPLRARDYVEVIDALRTGGRIGDALALCERAIAELPYGTSVSYPFFFKGWCLLHAWDERGIGLIYRAMEGNGNFIREGLEAIGEFCRLSGNSQAMREFEERAPELLRRYGEVDSEMNVLRPTDDLRTETLPDVLKEELLGEIAEIGGGEILRIYLLRKTVTPTRRTSAMIVQFDPETPPNIAEEIMQKLHYLLDGSTDHQFSLFNYDFVSWFRPERFEGSLFYEKEGN